MAPTQRRDRGEIVPATARQRPEKGGQSPSGQLGELLRELVDGDRLFEEEPEAGFLGAAPMITAVTSSSDLANDRR
jgi:hypothetical protein